MIKLILAFIAWLSLFLRYLAPHKYNKAKDQKIYYVSESFAPKLIEYLMASRTNINRFILHYVCFISHKQGKFTNIVRQNVVYATLDAPNSMNNDSITKN